MNNFIHWWQHIPEHIKPVAFRLGPVEIYYYGLLFFSAILVVYTFSLYRLSRERAVFTVSREALDKLFSWFVVGALAGGRMGYVLFYNAAYYLHHPLEIILPVSFEGGVHYAGISGMSYHGGLFGVLLAGVLFSRRHRIAFTKLADFFIPFIPLGYTLGRLGNFVNGELYGRPTQAWWGMYFPGDPSGALRHPSQLYEALFEGVVLFIILWALRKKDYFKGYLLAMYLVGYGLARFFIEFFREPDPQLGLVAGPFTMGQLLCLIMVIAGIVFALARIQQEKTG